MRFEVTCPYVHGYPAGANAGRQGRVHAVDFWWRARRRCRRTGIAESYRGHRCRGSLCGLTSSQGTARLTRPVAWPRAGGVPGQHRRHGRGGGQLGAEQSTRGTQPQDGGAPAGRTRSAPRTSPGRRSGRRVGARAVERSRRTLSWGPRRRAGGVDAQRGRGRTTSRHALRIPPRGERRRRRRAIDGRGRIGTCRSPTPRGATNPPPEDRHRRYLERIPNVRRWVGSSQAERASAE